MVGSGSFIKKEKESGLVQKFFFLFCSQEIKILFLIIYEVHIRAMKKKYNNKIYNAIINIYFNRKIAHKFIMAGCRLHNLLQNVYIQEKDEIYYKSDLSALTVIGQKSLLLMRNLHNSFLLHYMTVNLKKTLSFL